MEVVIIRPYRCIAFISAIIVVILLIAAIGGSGWLNSEGIRQGLWVYCVENNLKDPETLPAMYHDTSVGCHTPINPPWYITLTGVLCCLALACNVVGGFFLVLLLFTKTLTVKRRLISGLGQGAFFLGIVVLLTGLVLLPLKFWYELALWRRSHWEFGWAFGLGWGATIFLFAAVILMILEDGIIGRNEGSREASYAEPSN